MSLDDPGPLRIKKVTGGSTTVYIFSGAKVIAEYVNGALSLEYVYAGSQLLASVGPSDSFITYHHPDHLSIRVQSDTTGAVVRYNGQFPFGEIWYTAGPPADKWQFTSYERDSESQLDYAIFRGYSSRLGRFMQADPLAGSTSDPQSMNRYSYVLNDPVNFIDPLGLQRRRGDGGNEQDILLPEMNHPGCTLDGAWIMCSLGASIASTGAGMFCPLSNCNFVRWDPETGQLQYPVWVDSSSNQFVEGPDGVFYMSKTIAHFEWQTIGYYNISVLSDLFVVFRAYAREVPIAGSINVPFYRKVLGFSINWSVNPKCVGVAALATSPTKKYVNAGPLLLGDLGNKRAILSGLGSNLNVQLDYGRGFQVIWNAKGMLGGPTGATEKGVSLSSGYTWCE